MSAFRNLVSNRSSQLEYLSTEWRNYKALQIGSLARGVVSKTSKSVGSRDSILQSIGLSTLNLLEKSMDRLMLF